MMMRSPLTALLLLAGCGTYADAPASDVEIRRALADPAAAPRDALIRDTLRSTSALWQREFKARNCCFVPAQGVIYNGRITTPCRDFVDVDGANFCRADHKVYFSDQTWTELAQELGHISPIAQAVAVAHEVGHLVQQQTGTYGRVMRAIQTLPSAVASRLNAKLEAQADCYAGIWIHAQGAAYSAADIQDAVNSRRVGGDDYQQMKVRGYVDPAFVDHGSSQYRIDWFRRGLARGEPDDCEIFDGTPL